MFVGGNAVPQGSPHRGCRRRQAWQVHARVGQRAKAARGLVTIQWRRRNPLRRDPFAFWFARLLFHEALREASFLVSLDDSTPTRVSLISVQFVMIPRSSALAQRGVRTFHPVRQITLHARRWNSSASQPSPSVCGRLISFFPRSPGVTGQK